MHVYQLEVTTRGQTEVTIGHPTCAIMCDDVIIIRTYHEVPRN